eukprot:403338433
MGGNKKNKQKKKQSSQVQGGSTIQDPLQLNSQMLADLTNDFQDYLKSYSQQISNLPMTTAMLESFRELEVPLKFKINSEDLEVKEDEFKQLEISQKKVNNKLKAAEVLQGFHDRRTQMYLKFSPPDDYKNQIMTQFLRDQKFTAYSIANNGTFLWKSMMHERFRWLKHIRVEHEYGMSGLANQDSELNQLLKNFISRSTNQVEDREQRKMMKVIMERYNNYFRGKPNQQLQFQNGVPAHILQLETHIYAKVIHNLKKILKYLHQRLQQVMVYSQNQTQNGPSTVLIFKPYESNKVFYLNFFNCIMNYYLNCKQKYKEFKPLIEDIGTNVQTYFEYLKLIMAQVQSQSNQIQNQSLDGNSQLNQQYAFLNSQFSLVSKLAQNRKNDSLQQSSTILGMKYQTILKNFFVLYILQDPLINKLILQFKDQIVEDLKTPFLNGELDKDEYQSQSVVKNSGVGSGAGSGGQFKNNMSGCLQIMRQRWVEWYRYMYHVDLFRLHEVQESQVKQVPMDPKGNISFNPTNKLRLTQLVCDQLEWLSDDSDEGRDSKYNILDETDMIEEEDECAEDEDDEGCDEYEPENQSHRILPKNHNVQYNNFVDPSQGPETQLNNQKSTKQLTHLHELGQDSQAQTQLRSLNSATPQNQLTTNTNANSFVDQNNTQNISKTNPFKTLTQIEKSQIIGNAAQAANNAADIWRCQINDVINYIEKETVGQNGQVLNTNQILNQLGFQQQQSNQQNQRKSVRGDQQINQQIQDGTAQNSDPSLQNPAKKKRKNKKKKNKQTGQQTSEHSLKNLSEIDINYFNTHVMPCFNKIMTINDIDDYLLNNPDALKEFNRMHQERQRNMNEDSGQINSLDLSIDRGNTSKDPFNDSSFINEEMQAYEDQFIEQFELQLDKENRRAAESARPKLKPNLNKDWIQKYKQIMVSAIERTSRASSKERQGSQFQSTALVS